MLSFQKLDVYRCAVEFLAFAFELSLATTRGHASILDQLKRVATSVSLNIAEAVGRTGSADAARTYAIARGSAMECAPSSMRRARSRSSTLLGNGEALSSSRESSRC